MRLEPFGALAFDKPSGFIIALNRSEAKLLLGEVAFPPERVAPIYAHIELTSRCNLNCPGCYVDRGGGELSLQQLKAVLRDLARAGVLSVTFGGGEPLLRGEDLFKLAKHARELGLGVSMTTNGTLLEARAELSAFHQINISVHRNLPKVKIAIAIAKAYTRVGMNLIGESLNEVEEAAEFCKQHGVELLLLAYKPVKGTKKTLPASEIPTVARRLARGGVKVAVDGLAVGDCRAAKDFVDISSEGEVYPCSFIRKPFGNLLERSFSDIWRMRPRDVKCPFRQC